MEIELNTDIELAKGEKKMRDRTKSVSKPRSKRSPASVNSSNSSDAVRAYDAETRRQMIEEAAYYIAQRRGFETGHELEDWLDAERDVDARIYGELRPF